MGFFKRLFCKIKEIKSDLSSSSNEHYYICMDNEVFGPFSLQELKKDYPILKDTLITTDTLNSEWYEAKYFECFDELFDSEQDFTIGEDGVIKWKKRKTNEK